MPKGKNDLEKLMQLEKQKRLNDEEVQGIYGHQPMDIIKMQVEQSKKGKYGEQISIEEEEEVREAREKKLKEEEEERKRIDD